MRSRQHKPQPHSTPSAAPSRKPVETSRKAVIERLRQSIRQIEGRGFSFDAADDAYSPGRTSGCCPAAVPDTAGNNFASGDLACPRDLPEDGGATLRPAAPPAPPSSLLPFRSAANARRQPYSCFDVSAIPTASDPFGCWHLGAAAADRLIGTKGLDACGVHEIKPAEPGRSGIERFHADWGAVWGAARTFALALAARRAAMLSETGDGMRPILWCSVRGQMNDLGSIYAPGLKAFGIAPERLLIVEADKPRDALWVMEEALKAGSLALVIGMLDTVDLTPARRLALAAQTHATPCLILTHPAAYPMAATASRWRIAPLPSAPHVLAQRHTSPSSLSRLPGLPHLKLGLERHRARSLAAEVSIAHVAWCHETLRFRMASPVRDRTHDARPAWRHTA